MPKFYNQPYIPDLDSLISYDSNGRQEYVGVAPTNTREATARWSIYKITYDGSGRMTERRYANGTATYVHKWTERTSQSYTATN